MSAELGDAAGDDSDDERDGDTRESDDERVERIHLSRWFRRRPTSLEYWDAVVAGDELVWCFLGESFSSMLLRADVSEYSREEVENAADDELLSLSDRNRAVPLSALRSIEVDAGSRFRRSKLTVTWAETAADSGRSDAGETVTWELYGTSDADPEPDLVESLPEDDRFAHVDVSVERRSGWF